MILFAYLLKNVFTLNIEDAKLNEISSRKSDYITVEAVVLKHFQEYDFNESNNKFDLLREFSLKVPIHIAKNKNSGLIADTNVYIVNLGYDEHVGLHLKADDSNII